MAGFPVCKRYIVFWICQNMPADLVTFTEEICNGKLHFCVQWICQDSEYGRVLNMQELHGVLNMPQYDWICPSRTWICLDTSEFTITDRVLNMYYTIHSTSVNEYLLIDWCFRTRSKILMEPFGKIIIPLNYFYKRVNLKSFRGFWICVEF